jgi:hypothetical protein
MTQSWRISRRLFGAAALVSVGALLPGLISRRPETT